MLANRDLTLHNWLGLCKPAGIQLPAFTKGKDQHSPIEIEETRAIANVRIHVERNIEMALQLVHLTRNNKAGGDIHLIDSFVRVCCALSNVCNPIAFD